MKIGGNAGSEPSFNTVVDNYIADSTLAHTGHPHGVPTGYNWYSLPKIDNRAPPVKMNAVAPWGQIYVDSTAPTTAPNTRVEIGYMEMLLLTRSSGWKRYRWKSDYGHNYPEGYKGDATEPDTRRESSGFISVTAGNGKVYHFFPPPPVKTAIVNADTLGVIVSQTARLIVADRSRKDDRASARYLIGIGADWWRDVDAVFNPDFSNNPNAGLGRLRYVTSTWQVYRFSSLDAATLRTHPFDVTGI